MISYALSLSSARIISYLRDCDIIMTTMVLKGVFVVSVVVGRHIDCANVVELEIPVGDGIILDVLRL